MKHTGLEEELAAVLAGHQLELDDLEVQAAGKRRGRPRHCGRRRTVGNGAGPRSDRRRDQSDFQALDDTDALGDAPYTLEVSTRGVSRPLTKPAHYRRNLTRLVTLTLADGTSLTGRISAADERSVTVDVDGEERTIGFDQISKAVIQVEMNRRLTDDHDEAGE